MMIVKHLPEIVMTSSNDPEDLRKMPRAWCVLLRAETDCLGFIRQGFCRYGDVARRREATIPRI